MCKYRIALRFLLLYVLGMSSRQGWIGQRQVPYSRLQLGHLVAVERIAGIGLSDIDRHVCCFETAGAMSGRVGSLNADGVESCQQALLHGGS